MGFSSHLSTANEITTLLWVSFSDFSLNCFSLRPSMHASGEILSRIDILSHITCPHITAQLVRLLGWSQQTNFRPSTLMQANKGAWCHVARQLARRICRITLDLLVIKKKKKRQSVTPPVAISEAVCWFQSFQSTLAIFCDVISLLSKNRCPVCFSYNALGDERMLENTEIAQLFCWLACQENKMWGWVWRKLIIISLLWDRMAGIISTLPSASCLLPPGFTSHNRHKRCWTVMNIWTVINN